MGGYKHGMYKSREYSTWLNMHERCRNPNRIEYKRYGGRGMAIKISVVTGIAPAVIAIKNGGLVLVTHIKRLGVNCLLNKSID